MASQSWSFLHCSAQGLPAALLSAVRELFLHCCCLASPGLWAARLKGAEQGRESECPCPVFHPGLEAPAVYFLDFSFKMRIWKSKGKWKEVVFID